MSKKIELIKSLALILVVFALLLSSTACNNKDAEIFVTWTDADGSLIEYAVKNDDYNPSERELPQDSNEWHYTGWSINRNGKNVVCTAIRVKNAKLIWYSADGEIIDIKYVPYDDASDMLISLPQDTDEWHYANWSTTPTSDGFTYKANRVHKTKHIWKDADGTILKEEVIIDGEESVSVDLPPGDEKWIYTEWKEEHDKNEKIFVAQRTPNSDYFAGNVFQIIVKDENGEPLCSGSGFVINDEGWFITNNHVMENGYSAIAFFDIKDRTAGSQYTQLGIIGGVYNSSEKDIFIGKLDGYEKIKSYYNPIEFTENYSKGETAYTVGYPNSSVKMEINSGEILEEYSDIYDKINGVYYILSDSFIAPGSSGGILMNEQFEVIGITTIGLYADSNKQIYQAGGSVPTFVFNSHLSNLNSKDLKSLTEIYKETGDKK